MSVVRSVGLLKGMLFDSESCTLALCPSSQSLSTTLFRKISLWLPSMADLPLVRSKGSLSLYFGHGLWLHYAPVPQEVSAGAKPNSTLGAVLLFSYCVPRTSFSFYQLNSSIDHFWLPASLVPTSHGFYFPDVMCVKASTRHILI